MQMALTLNLEDHILENEHFWREINNEVVSKPIAPIKTT